MVSQPNENDENNSISVFVPFLNGKHKGHYNLTLAILILYAHQTMYAFHTEHKSFVECCTSKILLRS